MMETAKFDINCLETREWRPSKNDVHIMGQKLYDEAVAAYEKAEKDILFKDVHVKWDSCDCNDGLCSHGSFPCEIRFSNQPEALITIDGKGYNFDGPKGILDISHDNFTLQDFERFCELTGIQLIKK